jgi:hypothetical protein
MRLPEQTTSNWSTKESGFESDSNNNVLSLKPPSGNCFRVIQILGLDKNEYLVAEAFDWLALVIDVLK